MNRPQFSPQQGVMLLEALIGILIFTIGILALIAMQAVAITNTIEARYRTEASFLANELIGQIWVDRGSNNANVANYDTAVGNAKLTIWINKVAATLPGVTANGANSPSVQVTNVVGTIPQVAITIFWKRPDSNAPVRQLTTIAQIAGN
jgi:type IV pilus assembly protein PilV